MIAEHSVSAMDFLLAPKFPAHLSSYMQSTLTVSKKDKPKSHLIIPPSSDLGSPDAT